MIARPARQQRPVAQGGPDLAGAFRAPGTTCSTPAARRRPPRSHRRGREPRAGDPRTRRQVPGDPEPRISVDAEAEVRSVVGTKLVKNGQMCISVDYALVPRGQVEDFVAHAQDLHAPRRTGLCEGRSTAPGSSSARHLDRLIGLMRRGGRATDADRHAGGRRRGRPRDTRRMPLSLVIDPAVRPAADAARRSSGPLLPVDAVRRPRCRDRRHQRRRAAARAVRLRPTTRSPTEFWRRTTSGGACGQHLRDPERAAVDGLRRHRA